MALKIVKVNKPETDELWFAYLINDELDNKKYAEQDPKADGFYEKDAAKGSVKPTVWNISTSEYPNYAEIREQLVEDYWNLGKYDNIKTLNPARRMIEYNDSFAYKLRPSIAGQLDMLIQPYPLNYEGEKTVEMLNYDMECYLVKWGFARRYI